LQTVDKNFSAREPIYLPFYYERLLRILPNYFFVALLTLAFIAITGFGKPKLTFLSLFNNALVIPLNYYMYFDNSILTEPKWWLIPPAWSLGAELQAYLVLPLVVYFRSMKIIFSISSFVVFSLACVGILHTEHFGYRLLPGVLFIFILGVTTCNNTHREGLSDLFDKYFPVITYALVMVLLIILAATQSKPNLRAIEVAVGILNWFAVRHLSGW